MTRLPSAIFNDPEAVPRVLYEDQSAGLFVMEYLPPARYPVWKEQLRDGLFGIPAE